jgi:hypothetical protein
MARGGPDIRASDVVLGTHVLGDNILPPIKRSWFRMHRTVGG